MPVKPQSRSPEQADVLDMVVRLKQAADRRAAEAVSPAAQAEMMSADGEFEFPAEFYQYFTVVRAA